MTKVQIREILMHSALYCGIPAAVDGFRNAEQTLDELGVESALLAIFNRPVGFVGLGKMG